METLEVWLEQAATELHAAVPVAVRIPGVPAGGPQVLLEDPAAVALLSDLARASNAVVFYTCAFALTDDELERHLRRLGLESSDTLATFVGTPVDAAVSVVAAGVVHTVSARSRLWQHALEAAEVEALVDGSYGLRWEPVDEIAAFRETLNGLADRLKGDEDFLTSATNEQLRRQYATAVVHHAHPDHDGELSVQVRGRIAAAAASAWSWWTKTGRPERTQALRVRLPELVDDVAGGTQAERKASALEILRRIDAAAVTSDLVSTLAKMAPRHPPVM
ncbi:hypothetical protein [Phycicoccus flavus]|uniref:Uncharacterized protein n=1 Tax=Phycicoccus flavus TaxID=2502783 RepID=A0A8T6RAX7_9MICO|nr:hypothetical protein [Phycicoccus flavus]NHA69975.1 hypothetical protein [Phycicoccus flavus]